MVPSVQGSLLVGKKEMFLGTSSARWAAVVTRTVGDELQVLMVRRADDGRWTPVTGIVDPGEHPELAAVRETLEESSITARVVRLAQVGVTRFVEYTNGDRTQYLDLSYRCEYVSGEPYPAFTEVYT